MKDDLKEALHDVLSCCVRALDPEHDDVGCQQYELGHKGKGVQLETVLQGTEAAGVWQRQVCLDRCAMCCAVLCSTVCCGFLMMGM